MSSRFPPVILGHTTETQAIPQVNYTINPVLTAAAGEQQVVFAGFFDDDAAPTKYYMMHDFHSGCYCPYNGSINL